MKEEGWKNFNAFVKALEVWKEELTKNHPLMVPLYNRIGFFYCEMGKYRQALAFYLKSLEITARKRLLWDGVIETYEAVGRVYGKLGDYEQQLKYYKKRSIICLRVFGYEHETAMALFDVGRSYANLKQYEDSFSNYIRAFGIWEDRLHMDSCPFMADKYSLFGDNYMELGDKENAARWYLMAGECYIESDRDLMKDNFEKAMKYLRKAIATGIEGTEEKAERIRVRIEKKMKEVDKEW